MTKKNALILIGVVVLLIAIPVTVILSKRISDFLGGAQQPPSNQFEDQLDASVCPSDATCSPFNYYLDCVVFGYMVAKVVDVTSGQEVDVTSDYNSANRLKVTSTHNTNTLWSVRLDSNLDNSLNCSATGRTGAYFGNSSCPSGGLLDGGQTYTEGKPDANTGYWCFNGLYNVALESLPAGYELVSIDVNQDSASREGQGGSVDLANKMVKDVNLCNYDYGPGNYRQMKHNYVFKVRQVSANAKPLCNLATVPSPATGKAPLTVQFDGSGSTDSDGSISKFEWKIDGQVVATDQNQFSHTFTNPGAYDVTLVVNDNENLSSDICSVSVNATTTANQQPVCIVETSPSPAQGDAPLTVNFDGSKSFDNDGSIASYEWKIGSEVIATTPTFQRVFSTPGSYEITLVVKDNQNLTGETCRVTVSPNQKGNNRPECKLTSEPENPSGNVPQTVKFDGTGSVDSDGSITAHEWTIRKDGRDIKESSSDKFEYRFTQAGKYKVILKVQDNQEITSDECEMDFTLSSAKKTYTTCDYAKQICVTKEGDQKSGCNVDADCKPKATVPKTGLFDNSMMFGVIAAVSLIALGLLVIL